MEIDKVMNRYIPDYKEYIPGTYSQLSLEDRMYYVNIIRNLPSRSSAQLYDKTRANIFKFFFECSEYIYKTLEDTGGITIPEFNDIHRDYNITSIETSDLEEYIMLVDLFDEQEYIYRDDVKFDIRFLDDNYLATKIQENIGRTIKSYESAIQRHKDYINHLEEKIRKINSIPKDRLVHYGHTFPRNDEFV